MTYQYTENTLDNLLFCEVSNEKPDIVKIRQLITQGANINATSASGDSLLVTAINYLSDDSNLAIMQLLIDLGADLNYTNEGFNCLFDACLTCNPKLVELLLEAGANPNCISTASTESMLDSAEFDFWFESNEEQHNRSKGIGRAKGMGEIVKLLKKYGAKPVSEIFTKTPEYYVKIFSTYQTGFLLQKVFLRCKIYQILIMP